MYGSGSGSPSLCRKGRTISARVLDSVSLMYQAFRSVSFSALKTPADLPTRSRLNFSISSSSVNLSWSP